jgi:hypothetical protein
MRTTALAFVALASVGLFASDGSEPAAPWFTPQTIFAVGGIIYGVGMLVQELRDLRRRLVDREAESKTFAKMEIVDLRFVSLLTEVHALRAVVEQNSRTSTAEHVEAGRRLDAFGQRVEAAFERVGVQLHDAEKNIVRLETSVREQK